MSNPEGAPGLRGAHLMVSQDSVPENFRYTAYCSFLLRFGHNVSRGKAEKVNEWLKMVDEFLQKREMQFDEPQNFLFAFLHRVKAENQSTSKQRIADVLP